MSAKIEIKTGGPLKVTGEFQLVKPDGTAVKTGQTALLCGCGRTSKHPFCNGKHRAKAVADKLKR